MSELTDLWISTETGAELVGYHPGHVRHLARSGAITAYRIGNTWIVSREDLFAYKGRMDALGDQRHTPWQRRRPDLAEEGRGRTR
jgi:excisionase family DNA binding protein